jgi:NADH:ubiquinone oxidoreductase subunit 3 (subunit A)
MLTDFGYVLLFITTGAIFVGIALFVSKLVRPDRPSAAKLMTYECGEEPIGDARVQFNNRFYITGLMFLIFEVEILLLFPWAVVFKEIGWFAFAAMFVFVFLIFIGFIYELGKGQLQWDIPRPKPPKYVEGVGVVDYDYDESAPAESIPASTVMAVTPASEAVTGSAQTGTTPATKAASLNTHLHNAPSNPFIPPSIAPAT